MIGMIKLFKIPFLKEKLYTPLLLLNFGEVCIGKGERNEY